MKLLSKIGIVFIVIGIIILVPLSTYLAISNSCHSKECGDMVFGNGIIWIVVGIILLIISGIRRIMKRSTDNQNKRMKETSTKEIQELKDKEIHELKERLDKLEKNKNQN